MKKLICALSCIAVITGTICTSVNVFAASEDYKNDSTIEAVENSNDNSGKIQIDSTKSTYKYKVIANNVNVRTSPSTSASIIGQMNWGDVCYSSGGPFVSGGITWLYVTCGYPLTGQHGYIAYQYLQEVPD